MSLFFQSRVVLPIREGRSNNFRMYALAGLDLPVERAQLAARDPEVLHHAAELFTSLFHIAATTLNTEELPIPEGFEEATSLDAILAYIDEHRKAGKQVTLFTYRPENKPDTLEFRFQLEDCPTPEVLSHEELKP